MVDIREHGSTLTTSGQFSVPGMVYDEDRSTVSEVMERVVTSNFLITPTGNNCRCLVIPSSVFSIVIAFVPTPTVGETLEYLVARVKKHSQWCDTQLHLLKKSPNLSAHRASGENLWQQQSSFICCDRCNGLQCYSMKASCARRSKSPQRDIVKR